MIVRVGLIKKKPEWTMEAFRRHWLEQHGALAAKLPGLLRYEQNHVIDSEQRGIAHARGPDQIDGFSMLWFESEASMRASMSGEAGKAAAADNEHYIGNVRILTIEQFDVMPPQSGSSLLKRMSLLRRRPEMTSDKFRLEWCDEHARLVNRIDGVRGYRQNLVTGREDPPGVPVGYDKVPIDGIVELWFDDVDSISAAFTSPPGATAQAHGREFLAEVTTFLVERHVIV